MSETKRIDLVCCQGDHYGALVAERDNHFVVPMTRAQAMLNMGSILAAFPDLAPKQATNLERAASLLEEAAACLKRSIA